MKTTILSLLAGVCISLQLTAQSDEQVEEIYRHYAKSSETISFSFSHEILDAIDMEVDWDEYTKNVEGDFESIRLVIFQEREAASRSLALIQRKLESYGYQEIRLPEEEKQENLTLLALKENGHYRHVFALVNDADENEALMLAFTGNLTVKNRRL